MALSIPTTDLVYLYDFAALGLADGDAISSVSDLQGSNNLSQGTSGKRPTFKTAITPIGKSIARFDGTDDLLTQGSAASFKHLFVCLKITRTTNFADYEGVWTGAGAGDTGLIGNQGASTWLDYGWVYKKDGTTTLNAPFSAFALIEVTNGSTGWNFTGQIGEDRLYGRNLKADVACIFAYSSIQAGATLDTIRDAVKYEYLENPPPDSTPPSDVSNLTATKISNSQVNIDSDAATDNIAVTGYQTQRRINGGSWATLTPTTKAFSDTANYPTSAGTYAFEYRRKAFDAAGNYSANYSNIPSVSIMVNPPSDVAGLSASVISGTQINLDWADATAGTFAITDYRVYYNTVNSHSGELFIDVGSATSAKNVTGLSPNTTYYFWTKAVDAQGNYSVNYSAVVSVTTPEQPSLVTQHFEQLKICGIFNISDLRLKMPLLRADFGDGYEAGALSGKVSGLRLWGLTADVLPDLNEYLVDYTILKPQTGLVGLYYSGQNHNTFLFARNDLTVDFNFISNPPQTGLTENFSVAWDASIIPEFTGNYTLYTQSDDGVRLWLNGELLIDNWTTHASVENANTVYLLEGRRYKIVLHYFQNNGPSVIQLKWSHAQVAKQIIPSARMENDNLISENQTATRFQYFYEFFRRHLAMGNKPFYFVDPRTNRKFLASFVEDEISFEVFTAQLYGGGVPIKQRRVKLTGLTFREEDGSINE